MTPCPHSLHPPCSQSITVKRTWSPEFDQEEWLHTKPATPPATTSIIVNGCWGFEARIHVTAAMPPQTHPTDNSSITARIVCSLCPAWQSPIKVS